MAREGYVTVTRMFGGEQQIREFSLICWNNLGGNKQGWRLVNESDSEAIEIIEKKNLAEIELHQENVVAKNDDVPGFDTGTPGKIPSDATINPVDNKVLSIEEQIAANKIKSEQLQKEIDDIAAQESELKIKADQERTEKEKQAQDKKQKAEKKPATKRTPRKKAVKKSPRKKKNDVTSVN